MTTETEIIALDVLEYLPYLDVNGCLAEDLQGKIGAYAIFNRDKVLQYVGYSRDIYLSLKQHLIRQPQNCYWLKFQTVTRPNRTLLEEMRQAWIAGNGTIPTGNDRDEVKWTQPIDAKLMMEETEQQQYRQIPEQEQIKLLKQVARRVEAEVQEQLKQRGVGMEIRFNPKLKEQGLLDLK